MYFVTVSEQTAAISLRRTKWLVVITATQCVSCAVRTESLNIIQINVGFYVEIKCQLDATEVFIAYLIACSTCFGHHHAHHQELKSIIQWLLRVVFCAVVIQVAGLVWS